MIRLPCQQRVDAAEWVDDPELSLEDTRATLRDQAVMNRWLGGAHATLAHALPILAACAANPVRVLDAACGGADISRRLVDEARRLGKAVKVTALDLQTTVITSAWALSGEYPEIEFVQANALCPPFPPGEFDIVMMSTFMHHLQPEQVITLLQVSREICRGRVMVTDLVRSPLSYLGFWTIARLARFNPVTIHDGQVSICRAYTPVELAGLARRAGLVNWRVYRHPFFRMTLVYDGMPRCRRAKADEE